MAEKAQPKQQEKKPEKENVYQAEYLGSGTFRITKPRRSDHKRRLTKVHNPQRRARRY